jgi:putative ABC transport system substrate-binding protein
MLRAIIVAYWLSDRGRTRPIERGCALRRRDFIGLIGMAAAWPHRLVAQSGGRQYRIGILETVPARLNTVNLNALYKGLREHGYVEGQNLAIEYRSAEGRAERFPELAAELASRNVDVIVTRGTPAALAAKNAPGSVPVVMAAVGEPVGVGAVAELARPGGKVTGMSAFTTELAGKRVELLHDMMPTLRRFALLHNMSNPVVPAQWEETRKAAQLMRLEARLLDIRVDEDIGSAFEAAKRGRVEAILVGVDGFIQASRRSIIRFAEDQQLPAIYSSREFIDDGGFMMHGVSYAHLYFRAAVLIDKVLKGAKPGDLPIEQPTRFETVVNLKAARALGLNLSDAFLLRADEVIE